MAKPIYIHRTNKPGTCRWCGKKIYLGAGYCLNGANYFSRNQEDPTWCTMRCAMAFANAFVKSGHHLEEGNWVNHLDRTGWHPIDGKED